jgi:hypothetical protein
MLSATGLFVELLIALTGGLDVVLVVLTGLKAQTGSAVNRLRLMAELIPQKE